MLLYAPVYLFAIYDSYRTFVDLNREYILAVRENANFATFKMNAFEINYLDKRTPWVALVWSCLMPGMGQLYIHRIVTAFYVLLVCILITYESHLLQAIQFSLFGQFEQAKSVLDVQWFLFMPSVYFFAIYDAYTNTVENNKLFDKAQSEALKKQYRSYRLKLPLQSDRKPGDRLCMSFRPLTIPPISNSLLRRLRKRGL